MSQFLFLLLVLACPLMMVFMMKGMHGGHGKAGGHGASGGHGMAGGCHGGHGDEPGDSLDDLRRQRDELDRRIEQREADERTPVGSGVG